MKRNLWLTMATYLAYCLDQELWKAIDYLKEQVRVLKEQQEKDKRILLSNVSVRPTPFFPGASSASLLQAMRGWSGIEQEMAVGSGEAAYAVRLSV